MMHKFNFTNLLFIFMSIKKFSESFAVKRVLFKVLLYSVDAASLQCVTQMTVCKKNDFFQRCIQSLCTPGINIAFKLTHPGLKRIIEI